MADATSCWLMPARRRSAASLSPIISAPLRTEACVTSYCSSSASFMRANSLGNAANKLDSIAQHLAFETVSNADKHPYTKKFMTSETIVSFSSGRDSPIMSAMATSMLSDTRFSIPRNSAPLRSRK